MTSLRTMFLRSMTLGVSLLALDACGGDSSPEPQRVSTGDLAKGVVAEVGPEKVARETVARIAGAKSLPPREAADTAIEDALWAAGARADLPARVVVSAERRALAQALVQSLWVKARDEPITDAELEEATNVRWTRYDRPEGYRTVHFVVQVDEDADVAARREAEALARELREAVVPVAERARREPAPELDEEAMFHSAQPHPDTIVEPWKEAVESVDARGLSVIAQPLPPITAEGRPIEHDVLDTGGFDENFAREVSQLSERGALTGIFETYAGYHVAMLLETTPPRHASKQERLEGLRDEILRVRGLRRRRELLQRLRDDTSVEEPMNLGAILSLVRVELDED